MRLFGDLAFNLLFNALGGFWLALGLSRLLFRGFRLERHPFGVAVLVLPFVKLAADAVRGVPAASFFWLSEHGVRQTLGTFRVGFGATALGPILAAQLWADHAGGRAPQSAGDLAVRALRMKLGAAVAPAIACGVLAVSAVKLARLVSRRAVAFRDARALAERATLREVRRVGFRAVRVLESTEYAGAPFAAGLVAPFVLLPARLAALLTSAELEAVVAHELSHVRRYDVVLLVTLEILAAVCWYVPGLRGAASRVGAELERRADDAALTAGVDSGALARALVTSAELAHACPDAPLLAMASKQTMLASRLSRLLAAPVASTPAAVASRVRWFAFGLKTATVAWCALAVLRAVAFGNHAP